MPLKQGPWQNRDPLRLLREQKPKEAFQVNLKRRELRQAADPKAGKPHESLIGVERCTWGPLHASVPALPEEGFALNRVYAPYRPGAGRPREGAAVAAHAGTGCPSERCFGGALINWQPRLAACARSVRLMRRSDCPSGTLGGRMPGT